MDDGDDDDEGGDNSDEYDDDDRNDGDLTPTRLPKMRRVHCSSAGDLDSKLDCHAPIFRLYRAAMTSTWAQIWPLRPVSIRSDTWGPF